MSKFENEQFLNSLENIRRDLECSEKSNSLKSQISQRQNTISSFIQEPGDEIEQQIAREQHLRVLEKQRVEIDRVLQSLGY